MISIGIIGENYGDWGKGVSSYYRVIDRSRCISRGRGLCGGSVQREGFWEDLEFIIERLVTNSRGRVYRRVEEFT